MARPPKLPGMADSSSSSSVYIDGFMSSQLFHIHRGEKMRKRMVSCNMIKVFEVEFHLELSGLKKIGSNWPITTKDKLFIITRHPRA